MPTHASDIEPVRPETTNEPEEPGKPAPRQTFNGGSTRVNIAWPFSKISVQDPSSELRELAALVAELITALETTTGGQLKELRERSQQLADRLG